MIQIKKVFGIKKQVVQSKQEPEITFIVAAYNEKDCIENKILNSLALNYPKEKLSYIFVTDGSDDGTNAIVAKYPQITLLHQAERKGKSAALNRAMQITKSPITVFSDANTFLNKNALTYLVKHYTDPVIGGVSGEKKIKTGTILNNTGIGENAYWKYESLLKQLETSFHSLAGSAGELFSIRTALYKPFPEQIILDDFYTALKINEQGFKIVYEPMAVAIESPSSSLKEEKKRKVRIAAGAFQLLFTFTNLLNIFKYPAFAFQFISHKLLRWTLAPVCIVTLFGTNFFLKNERIVYDYFFYVQVFFYLFSFIGWILYKLKKITTIFYYPFYFLFMNYCNVAGLYNYVTGKQKVLWEKSKRQSAIFNIDGE
ncbi:MAG TPA: glycosyltransferase family 2 protein [Chitinophagaceae bacterium]|nr:glycosyltransferase family 2 protein [Chitinophagaceae bacterium]